MPSARDAITWLALCCLAGCASAPAPKSSGGPAGCRAAFQATRIEPLKLDPDATLVWREETFQVARPVDAYVADFWVGGAQLQNFLPGTDKVPGVDHNEDLTEAGFPTPGSKRVVCLTDGNWALEEVLARTDRSLRYAVSNYSLEEAKPVDYAIGEFTFAPLGADATQVTWRYSFKLRDDVFPGTLGGLGRWLFRRNFLDSDYAAFMKAAVAKMQVWVAPGST